MFCDINCKMSALLKNNLRNYRKSVVRRQTTGRISSCGIWARRKFLIFLVTLLCDVMIVIRDQNVIIIYTEALGICLHESRFLVLYKWISPKHANVWTNKYKIFKILLSQIQSFGNATCLTYRKYLKSD